MNSLDYIDGIFKIALNYYQNKDEVSAANGPEYVTIEELKKFSF